MPTPSSLEHMLPELLDVLKIVEDAGNLVTHQTLANITVNGMSLPLLAVEAGSSNPAAPVLVITGGVHGLERIGSRVVIAYMKTLFTLLKWDEVMMAALEKVRLVFIPVINPGGMFLRSRCNPNGVDLMRNSPVEREDSGGFPLVAGHRYSAKLPWFRGRAGGPMEIESAAVIDFLSGRLSKTKFSTILDVHSGFGVVDRLWLPFAYSKKPFTHAPEAFRLKQLLDGAFPNHIYRFEPQSTQYTTHGDLWDYLYLKLQKENPDRLNMPLALELGSWIWIKKNPRQILSATGMFNPIKPHRHSRILRRHLVLFDFLIRATASFEKWAFPDHKTRQDLALLAGSHWYKP